MLDSWFSLLYNVSNESSSFQEKTEMFYQLRKGDQVKGLYLGVQYTGTVRGARLNERTGNVEVEIDFPAPLSGFRGRDWDKRSGLILIGVDEGDWIKKLAEDEARKAQPAIPFG